MKISNKHKIRDAIIWLISATGISYLYRKNLSKNGPLVRVIAFHDVLDRNWFENVIQMLINNFNIISPKEFYKKDFDSKKINILLTFDDGYKSWTDICLPTLNKYNLKGLFFIISGLLDIEGDERAVPHFVHDRLYLSSKEVLSWEGAEKLIDNGHTVGGHTATHANLAELNIVDAKKEIEEDKTVIESNLNVMLDDFAYPFGRNSNFNEDTTEIVVGASYAYAYTAETGFVNFEKDMYEIPRTLIEKNQNPKKIKRWINGGYDILVRFSVSSR